MQLETNEIKSQLRQIQKELKTLKDKIEKLKSLMHSALLHLKIV